MGIIEKQATRNAIYSYLGAGLGLLTIFWMPRLLSTEENGLVRVLISFAMLFSQFSNLGFSAVTIRFFPHFRDKDKGHNGFLYYAMLIPAIGFIISITFFLLFKESIVANNIEKSKLLIDYIYYLLPLTFFTLFFNVFDTYLRAGYNSAIGALTKEIVQRALILITLCLYFFQFINFHFFIFLFTASVSIPTLILFFYIIIKKEWHTKRNKEFVTPQIRKEIIKLSSFTVLSEFSAAIIVNIDSIMLSYILGLSKTGVYAVAFNFGNLMSIPARSISRITSSIIVENFKNNNMKEIESLYKKSCNTQLAIGAFLLIEIILNLENIMSLLPPEYYSGKYVILILSIGYFIEMATGLNHIIIVFSKYYKYDAYFIVSLVIMAICSNYLFITKYGIIGSAIATASTLVFGNLMRSMFVYYKFRMQPYDINSLKIIVIGILAILPSLCIPTIYNVYFDIIIRSSIAGFIFMFLMLKLEATPELNNKIRKNLKRFSIHL